MDRYSLLTLCLTLFSVFQTVDSKWVEGVIETDQDWVFITRFCFLNQAGNFYYHLEYPYDYSIQNLLFYYDEPGQWEAVYKKDLTCDKKVERLQNTNKFALSSLGNMCNDSVIRNNKRWVVCDGDMDFNSARERWWFVVLSRCSQAVDGKTKGMYLRYKIHMTNGDDLLHKEFSADEFYILVIDIIFFILYAMLLVMSIGCALILHQKQLLHTTYKMYLATLVIWTLNLLCLVIAWGSLGTTGWEIKPLEVVGRILQACAHIIFMLMLILMAKGYTIVRGRLTKKNAIKMTVFIHLYIIAVIILFIWEGVMFDPGLVLYYYESPPGYGMITIILIGWLWFTKAAVFTLKHHPGRSTFYIFFYSIYTVWFWAAPVITMIAMFAMAKWTREKSVHGVQQFIAYLGHNIFLILTWPSKVNDNFPFTIRTSQVNFLNDELDESEDSEKRYTAPTDMGTGPNLDIFITLKKDMPNSNGEKLYGPADPNIFSTRFNSMPSAPPSTQYSEPSTVGALQSLTVREQGPGSRLDSNAPAFPPLRGTGLPPIALLEETALQRNEYDLADGDNIMKTLPGIKRKGLLPPASSSTSTAQRNEHDLADEQGSIKALPPIRHKGLPPIVPSSRPRNEYDLAEEHS